MASASAADTWRETGRSTGGPGGPRGARPAPGERPVRPPLPPLPPLPSHGRPAPRPAVDRRAGAPEPAGRGPAGYGRPQPGYPRPSAALNPQQSGRVRPDDRGYAAEPPRQDERPRGRTGSSRAPGGYAPAPEQGSRLRGSVAVLAIFVLTLGGAFLDSLGDPSLGLVTLVALVGSTAAATLVVRRRDLVTMVIAPPLVFLAVLAVHVLLTPGADSGPREAATLIATRLALGLGFPTMGLATGTALVIALIRWAARR